MHKKTLIALMMALSMLVAILAAQALAQETETPSGSASDQYNNVVT